MKRPTFKDFKKKILAKPEVKAIYDKLEPFRGKPFLSISIPEQPIAMQRPRINIKLSTRTAHVYNPQAELKEAHGWIFKEAMMHAHKNCTDKPLRVEFTFSFKRVPSNKKKYHTSTPDIDNCIKYYLDAMQDVVYFNDSQVVELSAKKLYNVQPEVNITVFEV